MAIYFTHLLSGHDNLKSCDSRTAGSRLKQEKKLVEIVPNEIVLTGRLLAVFAFFNFYMGASQTQRKYFRGHLAPHPLFKSELPGWSGIW